MGRAVRDALIISALSVIPKPLVARWMGAFARLRLPALLQRPLLRWYVWKYKVNLEECEGTLADYPSLVDFFTRALKPGARPVDAAPDAVVSPCDGAVYAVGPVKDGRLYQSDGRDYAVAELLGGDERYRDGEYVVIYLSPRDYHRVHTPCAGEVRRFDYLPGRLWPVFPAATRRIADLFSRNERLVTWLGTELGEVALVMVGAFGVGRIKAVYTDVVSNTGAPARKETLAAPHPLARAAELGRFEMGSTVILVFPRGSVEWQVKVGDTVRLGGRIARATNRPVGS